MLISKLITQSAFYIT